jgi:streptogrisin C
MSIAARRRRITVALIGTLLVAAIATPSAAGARQDAVIPLAAYQPDPADPAVTSLAKDRGITIEEAQRRIAWQESAAELQEELRAALGGRFGGLWIDAKGQGRIKVGIVGGGDAGAGTLIARRDLTAVTDLVPVRYGYDQLEAASAWLSAETEAANRGAAARLGTSVAVDRNQVRLWVPPDRPLSAAQRQVVGDAEWRLGGIMGVEHRNAAIQRSACMKIGTYDCDAPLRAGVSLYVAANGSNSFQCTSAFPARSISDNTLYLMTAGHCGAVGTNFSAYQPSTGHFHAVGAVHSRSVSGNNDYAIIRIGNPSGWTPRAWVWVHGSSSAGTAENQSYPITGTGTSPPGTRVCVSGAVSGTDCGDVLEVDWNGPGGLARVDLCANATGDSGGPIYSNNRARGIFVGWVQGSVRCLDRLFQGITEAAKGSNVNVAVQG